jgi:enterochelin esterase-like enzyme
MKRLIYGCAGGVAALALIAILICPSLLFGPAALRAPPAGFDVRREGIERGKVETVEYDSKAAGGKRTMRVYTPPGFSLDQEYPVLYLLHGSLADETSWVRKGAADAILDNLYAHGDLVPMIVVMPNGNLFQGAVDAFAQDLIGDIIPYVERHFPVKADREHRALAGVSWGGHQALAIGLPHAGTFAYLGVFIGGLVNCQRFEEQHRDAMKDLVSKKKLTLLWLASGKDDLAYDLCQDTRALFDRYRIPYVYVEGKGLHDWETSRNDLFVFAPLLFRDRQ